MKLIELATPIQFTKPNFDYEYNEVEHQREVLNYFKSKKNWLTAAEKGKPFSLTKRVWDMLDNHDDELENLEDDKIMRAQSMVSKGEVEMPIVLFDSEYDRYHLLAGNTRLAILKKNKLKPTVWLIKTPGLIDYF